VTKDGGIQIVDRVLRDTAAAKLEPKRKRGIKNLPKQFARNIKSPLHVPPLCPPQRNDIVLLQDIQAQRVDALLIDDNKALFAVSDDLLLELDDLGDLGVDVLAFGSDELFALFGAAVEEARVDFAVTAGCVR